MKPLFDRHPEHPVQLDSSDGLEEYSGDFGNFAMPDDQLVADILHRRKQMRSASDRQPENTDAPQEMQQASLTTGNRPPEKVDALDKGGFVLHHADSCAHVRSGLTACGDCVDICPQDALSIADGGICIDHSTCDGCGACALVCPTGAIRGLRTSTQDLLVAVQGRIADTRLANPGTAPTVTFIQLAPDEIGVDAIQGGVGKPSLSIAVAKIGCVGPEVWLGALAYGAAAVVLQTPEDHPRQLQAVLVEQHAWATTILAGVGLSPRRIQLRAAGFSEEAPVDSADVPGRPADFSPFQSKRMLIRRSVAHLAGKADITNAAVALPAGAPFGGIAVDGSACTLCMACAGECPTRALNAAGDPPDLRIVESDCIQCGRCRTICPEQAIQLLPRMLLDPAGSQHPRRLCAQATFACISCGQGFAPAGLVARMVQRLNGHWMYSGEKEIRRLKMCPDCRVRDLFLDNQPERRP